MYRYISFELTVLYYFFLKLPSPKMCIKSSPFMAHIKLEPLKPRPNNRNMPTQHIGCIWPTCCDMLGVVGSNLTIFKLELTTPSMLQHVATQWPNTCNMLCPTMLRCVALTCCDHLAWALQSYMSWGLLISMCGILKGHIILYKFIFFCFC